jgi:predicted nucleotidyltransferase
MGTTSVADALFSKVQQRVLAVLFGRPDRSFYGKEVITLAGSGSGAVQRELARLTQAGLVTVTRIGRQTHYQANPAAPVFPELRALVLKTSGLADVLRAALAPFAGELPAAFVFGSVARGEDTTASDVDLLVVSETLGYPDLYGQLEAAEDRLGRRINPTVYTRAELARRVADGNAFATRVLDGPKIWLIGGADDLPAR